MTAAAFDNTARAAFRSGLVVFGEAAEYRSADASDLHLTVQVHFDDDALFEELEILGASSRRPMAEILPEEFALFGDGHPAAGYVLRIRGVDHVIDFVRPNAHSETKKCWLVRKQ